MRKRGSDWAKELGGITIQLEIVHYFRLFIVNEQQFKMDKKQTVNITHSFKFVVLEGKKYFLNNQVLESSGWLACNDNNT